VGVGWNGKKEEWRDGTCLEILIAFCLFVSTAGRGGWVGGGSLLWRQIDYGGGGGGGRGAGVRRGIGRVGVMGYVDYFAPTSHLTSTGHDRLPFAQLCVCVCV